MGPTRYAAVVALLAVLVVASVFVMRWFSAREGGDEGTRQLSSLAAV